MNTKKVLKQQGLLPKTSKANEMQLFGFLSMWVVLSAVIYFS
ncbi:hypothetical protein N9C68_03860 [Gammaproteobacteria bacterium]|jgi:hypothetical protein|nr:hypothetical protein [Gammaproteobacteria bacterium]MDA8799273.1 hypothetical protein [Gammaproteobacteria bacterium]MDA9204785.1 hypothetical protein [Gammaproteobacteria bacterium]MDA9800176.1 hypothetical protein [Gammaproteobacteria bacterium]MDA9936817.1 hypothetical protein [Gammaproteobacteria bacterium]